MGNAESGSPARILVVDDNESVLLVLSLALSEGGFEVMTASSGEAGLEIAREKRPDVILLDVMMPHLSGLEVCERLQNDARTRDIPIIFLSARATTPDRVKGLERGAVDYVTKPFDLEEVMSRVRVALRTFQRQRDQEAELEKLKREFIHLLSHELATPLTAIRGFTELLETGLSGLDGASQLEYLHEISRSSRHLSGTLDDMLALAEAESFNNRKPMDIRQLIEVEARELETLRQERHQRLVIEQPDTPVLVQGHPRFLPRAVHALLSNACKFGGNNTTVTVRVRPDGTNVILAFEDEGAGIDPALRERVFERFYQIDPSRTRRHPGLGVGLAVARRVARALGGEVSLSTREEGGSRFTLCLPAAVAPSRGERQSSIS